MRIDKLHVEMNSLDLDDRPGAELHTVEIECRVTDEELLKLRMLLETLNQGTVVSSNYHLPAKRGTRLLGP